MPGEIFAMRSSLRLELRNDPDAARMMQRHATNQDSAINLNYDFDFDRSETINILLEEGKIGKSYLDNRMYISEKTA